MHWYGGSIAEAVTLSKQKNAIFVVFVEGDNELSQEMTQTIDDTAVVSRLSNQNNFLAIKLKSGSTNYTHFAQIYQFVPVPSLFFIGRNGTPLEVVCAGVQPNNLATRIDRILEEHYKEKPSHMQPSTSSQNIKEQTASLLRAEASVPPVRSQEIEEQEKPDMSSGPAAKVARLEPEAGVKMETDPGEEYEVVCSGDVCVRRPKSEQDAPSTSKDAVPDNPVLTQSEPQPQPAATESAVSIEEKLEKAKELIEARRREKAQKEKELEKQKELERRAAGKGVADLKKWQAEQEFKQIQEERRREKMENDLARQRILEQIAQDRAERRARDSAPAQPQPLQSPPATSGDASTGTRIQFKLPDGTSHTAQFEADGTLADVQRYVAENLQLSASSFSLWTAFPRRELTDGTATLRGLELAPSAALLVLPTRNRAEAVVTPSIFTTLIAFITQLFTSLIVEMPQQLYQWVRARLFPPAAPRSPSPVRHARPPPPPSSGPRRRGNVHRLPGDRGEDDDNNTWNGNSTQQM